MLRRTTPAIDTVLAPRQGFTRSGQPISYNRSAAPDLKPWIARLYAIKVDAPPDYTLSCGLFKDMSCLRVQLAGKWFAHTADGPRQLGQCALFFGPHSRRMPVQVTGGFISVGAAIRPGACAALRGPRISDLMDRFVHSDALGIPPETLQGIFDPDAHPEEWLVQLENLLRTFLGGTNLRAPSPVSSHFEQIAYRNPSITVSEAAEECGVERRRLERTIGRDFGLPPKRVLRRARALDMASYLHGVVDVDEATDIALRYYDDSHMIHEFTEMFGMSPRQFVQTPQPLMTLQLESRQARRLEALNRLMPGAARPWNDAT